MAASGLDDLNFTMKAITGTRRSGSGSAGDEATTVGGCLGTRRLFPYHRTIDSFVWNIQGLSPMWTICWKLLGVYKRCPGAVDYSYRPEIQHKEGYCPPTVSRNNLIGLSRARRPHAIFLNFDDKNVSTEPLEAAKFNWKRVCVHPSDIKAEEQLIRSMFESRPIWSRNSVKANLGIHPDKLKLLLPIVAYYMVRTSRLPVVFKVGVVGIAMVTPWLCQGPLQYQARYTINDMPVKAKRTTFNYTLPITLNKASEQLGIFSPEGPAGGHNANITRYQLKESSYIFRDGTLPPHRQMFYQLCDLDVQSIRNVVHRNDGQEEEECDERDGWCLSHTSDDLRDIMSSMIKQVIRAKRPGKTSLCNTDVAPLWPTWPGIKPGSGSETSPWGIVIIIHVFSVAPYPSGPESFATRRKAPESGEDGDEEDEFHPSEGSDNEMETEMLDYM
eukprot:XP_013984357.1 PREDICTED: general transcription factor 3C polypeptide 5-like [Salmo salar]